MSSSIYMGDVIFPGPTGQPAANKVNYLADTVLESAQPIWSPIRMIEETDPVLGGPRGTVNIPIVQISQRTEYLKRLCADLAAAIPGTAQYSEILQKLSQLDVAKLNSRTDHIERILGDIMLTLDAQNMSPTGGYDAKMIENFNNTAEEIDLTVAEVTSIVQGDDSIDVKSSEGLIIGAHFQLTDGEQTEEVQIKEVAVAGSINRVILKSPVKNQYISGRAKLYRSSVVIYDGKAYGGGNVRTDDWTPNEIFSGSNTQVDVKKTIDYSDAGAFTITGATVINGEIVVGGPAIGIALVATGGRTGTWKQIDQNGDDLV